MTPRSILLVAQLAPPSTLVAARRTAGLTKYLARLGHQVTLVTSAVAGAGEVEGAAEVVRTRDLLASSLNWRRGNIDALSTAATYRRASPVERIVVPDLPAVTWVSFALAAARRLARRGSFDVVVTSGPPQSVHTIGASLKRRGLPWVADLRDGWTFEPPRPAFPTRAQRAADAALERAVLGRADVVVGVTLPIVEDARRRLGVRCELVTNGFDPEETVPPVRDGLLDPAKHELVHTGRMALSHSTPKPALDAVALVPADAALEVVFAGPLAADERELLDAPELDGRVRSVGALPRPDALALQRAANSLLVVTEGSTRRSVATGKLFEYLAAGPPIVVLGDETDAARIVAETKTGIATSASDPQAIATAFARVVAGDVPARDEAAVAAYRYDTVAARFSSVIESVLA